MPANLNEFVQVVKLNNDEAKNKIKELTDQTRQWIKEDYLNT